MADSILIAAALAHRAGYGGHAWALLQYVLGFRELGFEVTVVDRLEPGMVPEGTEQAALDYLGRLLEPERIPYSVLDGKGGSRAGLPYEEALARAAEARFLLNVMGFVRDRELLEATRRRVFLDIDPGFPQIWRKLELADVFAGHDDFVTVGRNVGREGCGVPTCGLRWLTIPHPVVLDRCPAVDGGEAFTTVGSWRGPYDSLEYDGRRLGLRAHEFRRFAELPQRVDVPFLAALEIDSSDSNDIELLHRSGWRLLEPAKIAADPGSYLRFVQSSLAEVTVAKGIYVDLRTGWLGDRTGCYLASGKPSLVQDTGLASHYPLGEGLVTYSTLEEAADGAERILADPAVHARAARRLAETELDSHTVLSRLVEELG